MLLAAVMGVAGGGATRALAGPLGGADEPSLESLAPGAATIALPGDTVLAIVTSGEARENAEGALPRAPVPPCALRALALSASTGGAGACVVIDSRDADETRAFYAEVEDADRWRVDLVRASVVRGDPRYLPLGARADAREDGLAEPCSRAQSVDGVDLVTAGALLSTSGLGSTSYEDWQTGFGSSTSDRFHSAFGVTASVAGARARVRASTSTRWRAI